MNYSKTVTIDAPLSEVWQLVGEIEVVAGCIPGLSDYEATGPNQFHCLITQAIGPVMARFLMHTTIETATSEHTVTVTSDGSDAALASRVRTRQRFEMEPDGERTLVNVSADVRPNGRIASIGSRIVLMKAEDIVTKTLTNLNRFLQERREDSN